MRTRPPKDNQAPYPIPDPLNRRLAQSLFLALVLLWATSATASDDGDHDLIGNMGSLQMFSHKFDLAIRHENLALADFYAHELEESIDATAKIESYHDKPIGQLTKSMLVPAFERLEQALDDETGDWNLIGQRFDAYIAACNACHAATDYGHIRIERTDTNPFMQSFEPVED